jgi:hypothetical protein
MQLTQERTNKIELEALYLVLWYADADGEVAAGAYLCGQR